MKWQSQVLPRGPRGSEVGQFVPNRRIILPRLKSMCRSCPQNVWIRPECCEMAEPSSTQGLIGHGERHLRPATRRKGQ